MNSTAPDTICVGSCAIVDYMRYKIIDSVTGEPLATTDNIGFAVEALRFFELSAIVDTNTGAVL